MRTSARRAGGDRGRRGGERHEPPHASRSTTTRTQSRWRRGIIIADTKFEFGFWNDEVILIDEVLTPDSSRFWPADEYRAGGSQPSFDKQPVRDWMAGSGWKDGEPRPPIPAEVVAATTQRYLDVYRMLTGEDLPHEQGTRTSVL